MNVDKKEILAIFGKNLLRLRIELKLTQEQLAGIVNVKQSTISEIESGKSNARLTTIWNLISVLSQREDSPENIAEKLFNGGI